jgi:hypothetical protein
LQGPTPPPLQPPPGRPKPCHLHTQNRRNLRRNKNKLGGLLLRTVLDLANELRHRSEKKKPERSALYEDTSAASAAPSAPTLARTIIPP